MKRDKKKEEHEGGGRDGGTGKRGNEVEKSTEVEKWGTRIVRR